MSNRLLYICPSYEIDLLRGSPDNIVNNLVNFSVLNYMSTAAYASDFEASYLVSLT